ncbi:hypothetical protein ACTWP5_08885 [Streptomyces sp. 4N509B]|uniref:hypothetical protein n=1 Tax=Streptomyces sp. 4N509B TaxID=3457413 RepID=UPI003FD37F97
MEIVVLLVLGVTTLVFASLVLRVKRAVLRTAERTRRRVDRARHTVSEATLAARAVQPGVVGEVARVRRALRSSLAASQDTLLVGAQHDPALREALTLLDQLRGHAGQLDAELAALTVGTPDRARVAERLPELRERADRIRRSAESLRSAAQDRARHDGQAQALDALHQQIAIEAEALRHWTPAPRSAPRPPIPRSQSAEG